MLVLFIHSLMAFDIVWSDFLGVVLGYGEVFYA